MEETDLIARLFSLRIYRIANNWGTYGVRALVNKLGNIYFAFLAKTLYIAYFPTPNQYLCFKASQFYTSLFGMVMYVVPTAYSNQLTTIKSVDIYHGPTAKY
jgi:hypothetical protein